jgi:uncharacterized protein YerC
MTHTEDQLRLIRQTLEQRTARLEETRTERNALIVALVLEEGRTYDNVAEIAGLSLPAVAKIARAAGIRRTSVQR